MLRSRVFFSVAIALIFVVGATVYRFAYASSPTATLTAINSAPKNIEQNTVTDSSATSTGTDASSTQLTTTDLISHQLLTDYLTLASQGQNTDEGISQLADKYADSIVSLNTSAVVSVAPLHVVADSKASLAAYGGTLSSIYKKYYALTASTVKRDGDISDPGSPAFATSMRSLGILFKQSAVELQAMSVPASLVDLHTKLIKNYLSSASTFTTMGNINGDATSAFGALAAQAKNSSDQTDILEQIQTTLLANGIYISLQ